MFAQSPLMNCCLSSRHPEQLGPHQTLLDGVRLLFDVEPGADPDPRELVQQQRVISRRRVLLEHRVQRLERSQGILLGLDRLEHVASLGADDVGLAPLTQRGEQILLLQLLDRGDVGIAIHEGPSHDQHRRAG